MNRQAHVSSGFSGTITAVSEALVKVPGADGVRKVAGGVLDAVGRVSPGSRRTAVYAGAGVLGALGLVGWPAAAAVVAVVWLTQPQPQPPRPGNRGKGRAATPPAGTRARTSSVRVTVEPSSDR